MIHNSSNDPVLIKKIRLKVWLLRDEVESVVKTRLKNNPGEELPDIADLIEEYKTKTLVSDEKSEEAAGPAVALVEDNAEEETNEETNQEENSEVEAGKVQIIQRRPPLEEEKLLDGVTLLAEIGMNHVFFFCNTKFLEGQSIVIEFLVPKKFIVNADVNYCRPHNMKSRIISEKKVPYRVAASFTFLREGERTLLRNFLQSVEPDIPAPVAKAPAKEKSSGDDFDDLDDLDL